MEKLLVQKVLDDSPDDLNVDTLIERLYLMKKLEDAEEQIASGNVVSHEEVKQSFSKWLN